MRGSKSVCGMSKHFYFYLQSKEFNELVQVFFILWTQVTVHVATTLQSTQTEQQIGQEMRRFYDTFELFTATTNKEDSSPKMIKNVLDEKLNNLIRILVKCYIHPRKWKKVPILNTFK